MQFAMRKTTGIEHFFFFDKHPRRNNITKKITNYLTFYSIHTSKQMSYHMVFLYRNHGL